MRQFSLAEASIQPRTSLSEFEGEFIHFFMSNLFIRLLRSSAFFERQGGVQYVACRRSTSSKTNTSKRGKRSVARVSESSSGARTTSTGTRSSTSTMRPIVASAILDRFKFRGRYVKDPQTLTG